MKNRIVNIVVSEDQVVPSAGKEALLAGQQYSYLVKSDELCLELRSLLKGIETFKISESTRGSLETFIYKTDSKDAFLSEVATRSPRRSRKELSAGKKLNREPIAIEQESSDED